jgi:hypothetical protein
MSLRARGESCTGGPQAVFGRLFQWLQFQRGGKPRGPIRDAVREFILDSIAIVPGTVLFGENITRRRGHSVASLAKQKGLDRRTLNKALVTTGRVPAFFLDRAGPSLMVDAVAGEQLADRMLASIPVKHIPTYLNCHRRQAAMIVQHGIVQHIGGGSPRVSRALNFVALADLNDFLARFRAAGVPVSCTSEGMANIIQASEIVRWPVTDIVRLVLDGG